MKKRVLNTSVKHMLQVAACCALGLSICAPVPAYASPQTSKVAQAGNVTGTVTDAQGEPIIGASVVIKGQKTGVVTDIDGKYTIKAKPGDEITISSVGCRPQTIKVGTASIYNATLQDDSKLLNEVVAIGYGTQRKGDLTSAVVGVKAEDFNAGKIGDAAELIKGKVAGLSVVNSSGDPNATSSIMLRGVTTLVGNVTPLILVDGIEGDLNTVAPENIESIDVLKDASAAAIYGTRGANGVVLITTKSGKREAHASASYSNYFSFSNWSKKADFMDSHDVIMGLTRQPDRGYDTDWLKAITRKSGFKHNHDFQVSGGTANASYSGDVSYLSEEGIMRESGNERLRMHLNYTQYLWNDILKFNFDVITSRYKYNNTDVNAAYRQAVIHNPTEPVYDYDGSYHQEFNKLQYYNPVNIQNEAFGNTRVRFSQMTGNVTVEPIKGWQTNVMLSWGEESSTSENFTSPLHYSIVRENNYNGAASKSEGNSTHKNLEATTRYRNTFNNVHRFEALLGYSYNENIYDGFAANNANFGSTAFLWNNLGNGSFLTEEDRHAGMSSYRNSNTLIGFFGRVSYGYDNRYNLLVSMRREGSSKFGDNHKWGNFPSVSAGWNIMNESFWKDNMPEWWNDLRLRVGYGVTGVIPGDPYLSKFLFGYAGYGDILSMDGNWVKSLEVTQNHNPDLKWERTNEWNFGLDFGFFNDRIHGSLDYYIKTTHDLLYYYNVPVPPNLYGTTLANVGTMRNNGVELALTGVIFANKDFTWETTLTLSSNKNKLVNLNNDLYETDNFQEVGGISDPISIPTHCMEIGKGLGDIWGLRSVGYDPEGYVLVQVADGNGGWVNKRFTTDLNVRENRQRLGNGMPDLILGWNHSLRYKGFDLALQFTGQFGYDIINAQRCFYENNSIAYNHLKSSADLHPAINLDGTPAFDENGQRIMVRQNSSQDQGFWSDHVEKGDFFKLANATIGYTLPLKGAVKNYLKNIRVFASATNLFTITSYSGIDPEVSNYFMAPGMDDRDKYPTTRSYSFGLTVTF